MPLTPQQRAENAIKVYLRENKDLNDTYVDLYSNFENEDLRLILSDFHSYVNCIMYDIKKDVNNFYSSLNYDFRRYTETIRQNINNFIELFSKCKNTYLQFYVDKDYIRIIGFLDKDNFDKNILECDIYESFPICHQTKFKPIDTIYIENLGHSIIQQSYKSAVKDYHNKDYSKLIEDCKELLLTIFKKILDDNRIEYDKTKTIFPALWGKVKNLFIIKNIDKNDNDNKNEIDFKKKLNDILQNLGNIQENIGQIRNDNKPGYSQYMFNCDKIQANLILNSTLTLAETLLCLAEEKENNVKEVTL